MKKYNINQKYVKSGLINNDSLYRNEYIFWYWKNFSTKKGIPMSVFHCWFPTGLDTRCDRVVYCHDMSDCMNILVNITNQKLFCQ